MAALDFPATPVDGQSYGKYIYDATAGVWNSNEPLTVARFTPSPTAPTVPSPGDGWFNTNTGVIYIYYVSAVSGYWVQAGSTNLGYPSGASVVTSSTRPGTPFVGQLIYESNTGTTFTWDGTAWKPSSGGASVVTSSTRPASPYVGQSIFETDTGDSFIWDGTAWQPGGGGGSIEISATAPSSPSQGDLWWDSDNGNLYIYYDDGNSQQWVAANGPQVFVGTTAPPGYQGQLWFDSTQGKTYIYYDDGTSAQWVSAIGGSLSGNVVDVKSATKTNTQTGSVASQGTLAITDLNISHSVKNSANEVLLFALVNGTQGTTEYNFQAGLTAAGSLIGIGDAALTRTRVGASNGNRGTSATAYVQSLTLVARYTPGTTASVTYGVSLINADSATRTLYLNRSEVDTNDVFNVRAASTLILQEVAR